MRLRTARYRAHALKLRSALEFPELPHTGGSPDVDVRLDALHSPEPTVDDPHNIQFRGSDVAYGVRNVGRFLIRSGREILIDPSPGCDPAQLRLSILGPVFALLLHLRSDFLLHGSAVLVDDEAYAFVGMHGAGKSTTAAALLRRGYPLITDDVLAVDLTPRRPHVRPSYPQLKLNPDSLASVDHRTAEAVDLDPTSPKKGLRVPGRFARGLVPLRRVYYLEEGLGVAIRRLAAREAVGRLLTHWYGVRFGERRDVVGDATTHFHACLRLAAGLEHRALVRSGSLEDLEHLTDLVEEDLPETRVRSAEDKASTNSPVERS